MEYSFAPLVDPNTVHAGLVVTAAISGLLMLLILVTLDTVKEKLIATVAWLLFLTPLSYNSFKTEPIPVNAQVTGVKLKTGITQTGGKYSTDQMFVTYQVPDGDASFKMREGTVYPDRVTLYRN